MYLRGLAGKTADDILNGLCQVAALLPQTYQEGVQLLAPTKQEDRLDKDWLKHTKQMGARKRKCHSAFTDFKFLQLLLSWPYHLKEMYLRRVLSYGDNSLLVPVKPRTRTQLFTTFAQLQFKCIAPHCINQLTWNENIKHLLRQKGKRFLVPVCHI